MSLRQAIVSGLLLATVVASGIQVARVSHEVRRLHGALESAQRSQDEHLADYSRLLLERSALASYQNVEHLAETELAMQFPDHVERVAP